MAAVAAGYRKGLVGAGWPVLLLSCTNGRKKRSFHLVGTQLLACKTVPGTIFLPTEKRKLRKGRGEPIFQGGQFIHVNIHSGGLIILGVQILRDRYS